MEAGKIDRRRRYTLSVIREAFFALLAEVGFAKMTVADICRHADINRGTFYLHYETINDLLEESAEFLLRGFTEKMSGVSAGVIEKLRVCPIDDLYFMTPEYITPYLGFVKERRKLLATVLRRKELFRLDKSYETIFRNVFDPILERFSLPEDERRYVMAFYLNGLMAIIGEWIKCDCEDPIEKIVGVMQDCVQKLKK